MVKKLDSAREETKQYDPKILDKLSESEREWFLQIMQKLEQVPKENKGLANFANGIRMGVSGEMNLPPKESKSQKRSWGCL